MSYDPAARRPTPLARALAAEIAQTGPLSVDRYMARCLWDERHGYYATREPIGRAGDFITAPEISQTFGELIGLWSAVVWQALMGAPARVTLAELGPGRGTLMRDALRATAMVPNFHAALNCRLVDASPSLVAMQRQTLASVAVPLAWSADATGLSRPAIVVANEFFDAFPVTQWQRTSEGWAQRGIGLDPSGGLAFCVLPAAARPDDLPAGAAPGDIAERIGAGGVIEQLRAGNNGPLAVLIIDYGHEATTLGDTLQAVRNHAHEHPLTSPGEADLSAQVDLHRVAHEARRAGLVVDGPITQAEFLGRLGIVERAHRLIAANPGRAAEIESGVARLIAPDSMGTRFKVLGLRTRSLPPLPGFEMTTREAGPT